MCMYIYIYTYKHTCMHACIHTRTHAYKHIYYACVGVCIRNQGQADAAVVVLPRPQTRLGKQVYKGKRDLVYQKRPSIQAKET